MVRKFLSLLLGIFLALMLPVTSLGAMVGSIRLELPKFTGKVELHRVGEAVKGGYRLDSDFGGGFVAETDILLPELPEFLAARAKPGDGITPDSSGVVSFSPLDEGLYLVLHRRQDTDAYTFSPFLISLPWDGNIWEVTASPKLERLPAPMPDTSDPGILDRNLPVMALSALLLAVLLVKKKALIGK